MPRLNCLLVFCALCAGSASAETVTIATFQDPSQDASQPMFSFDGNANMLTGSWVLPGLTMETIGGTFDDVTFAMVIAPGVSGGSLGAGSITFADGGDALLTVEFGSANISPLGFGATEFLNTNDVTLSGSILPSPVADESFSFAFANVTANDSGGFTATAAFTSSATLVPEPTTCLMLALGSVAALRRRRGRGLRDIS